MNMNFLQRRMDSGLRTPDPWRAMAGAALAAVLAAGCAVGPRYHQPAAAPVNARNIDSHFTAAAPAAEWWQQFGDPVLADLEARALAGNLDLHIAVARGGARRASGVCRGAIRLRSARAAGWVLRAQQGTAAGFHGRSDRHRERQRRLRRDLGDRSIRPRSPRPGGGARRRRGGTGQPRGCRSHGRGRSGAQLFRTARQPAPDSRRARQSAEPARGAAPHAGALRRGPGYRARHRQRHGAAQGDRVLAAFAGGG